MFTEHVNVGGGIRRHRDTFHMLHLGPTARWEEGAQLAGEEGSSSTSSRTEGHPRVAYSRCEFVHTAK